MNRPPQWHLEEPLEPRPCLIDRALEELALVRWTHVVPFAFVAFVVGLLIGMMAGLGAP